MSIANKKQGYLKGAVIIAAGGFISKLLGAVYRIPLTNILGGAGMGVYQMVYPLYCILLTISASAIPTGVARLISAGRRGAEKTAFKLYGILGFVASYFMAQMADPLAHLLGENAVAACTRALSPAVFFVAVLSVVRGYYQGNGNMLPTALTEICEQFVKVAVGILFAYLFRNNWQIAVAYTLLAVTLSEAFTAALALVFYAERPRLLTPLFTETEVSAHDVLAYTIPLTITALAAPLCQLAESVVFSRLLRAQGQEATALWGVFSGCAITLVNLPVSVTYGLAAASVPKITPLVERGEGQSVGKTVWKTYAITLAVSVPAALGLYVFAPLLAGLFFRSLALEQKELLVQLVRIMAVNAVTSSLVQTSSACLTAMGKPYYSTISQWVSSLLRVGITALCIGVFQLGAIGAAVAANSCYLVAFLLNFWYSIRVINRIKRSARDHENHIDRLGRGQRRLNYQGEKGA